MLGPSGGFYESLLDSFRCADELAFRGKPILEKLLPGADKAIKWIAETWSTETLVEPDGDASSAENNSSVVLALRDGNQKFLFTADAVVPALTEVAEFAESIGIDLKALTGTQVPHYGSKRNVGPTILDRIVGPKLKQQNATKSATISPQRMDHPSICLSESSMHSCAGKQR